MSDPATRALAAGLAGLALGYFATSAVIDFRATGRAPSSLKAAIVTQSDLARIANEYWPLTLVVTELYMTEGQWPTQEQLMQSAGTLMSTQGTQAQRVNINSDGEIIITLGGGLNGGHFVISPELYRDGGAIRWSCGSPDIAANLLPPHCAKK